MHVITRKRLNDFAEKYPETANALARWYEQMKHNNFANFSEIKTKFGSADQVGKFTVFNVGGNKVRLIAAVHYSQKLDSQDNDFETVFINALQITMCFSG